MPRGQSLQKRFLVEMQKPQCESWFACNQLLKSILTQQVRLSRQFQLDIKEYLPKIRNLLVLLLINTYKVKVSESYSYYNPYKEGYMSLCKEANYQKIDQWLDQLKQQEKVQQTTQLILEGLGGLLYKEVNSAKIEDYKFMLRQLSRYKIRIEREVGVVVNFMGRLQAIRLAENSFQNYKKEIVLIKVMIQLLAQPQRCLQNASNLGLIFDEPLLGPAQNRNIQKYIQLSVDYLLNLSQEQLSYIFLTFTRSSISYLSLYFLLHLTILLARQEQFYKLRHLYEKLIISQIARRGKCCKKSNIQDAVLRVTETYVVGFLQHCRIGKVGMNCLLQNVQLVQNEKNRERWTALGQLISNKEGQSTQDEFNRWKKEQNIDCDVRMCQPVLRGNDIWKISSRSIKKHKIYAMRSSGFTGLVNRGNQCYIISIVQALFMTKLLQHLLKKARPKISNPAIKNLTQIFQQLADTYGQQSPNVEKLKREGPVQFSQSSTQQDAQDYLISLMQQLQKQFKNEGLLHQFKKLFEIESKDTLECQQCQYKVQKTQHQYVHTIPHKEAFSVSHKETINDYKCPKCSKQKFTKTTLLTLDNRILIVHINRFSMKDGSPKKELPTQKIKRRVDGGFQLVGMVFHIGKRIQSGHYVYYSRIQKTKWAEMNDHVVTEFDLQREDEQFELQMKQEKTPYILFYKRNEKK